MTKQEQIEKMAHIMCEHYNKGFCAKGGITEICEDIPYCCYKNEAEALYDAGYGNVSEYKAEIERLEAENERFENNMKNVLEIEKKQAKIDVLNELKKKTHNYYTSIDSYCIIQRVVLVRYIDELLKEYEE